MNNIILTLHVYPRQYNTLHFYPRQYNAENCHVKFDENGLVDYDKWNGKMLGWDSTRSFSELIYSPTIKGSRRPLRQRNEWHRKKETVHFVIDTKLTWGQLQNIKQKRQQEK